MTEPDSHLSAAAFGNSFSAFFAWLKKNPYLAPSGELDPSGLMMVCLGCGLVLRDAWAVHVDEGDANLPVHMKGVKNIFPTIQKLEKAINEICDVISEGGDEYVALFDCCFFF